MTQTIFGQIGPYVIERPIGQGGMASVFLARDTRVGSSAPDTSAPERVALKVVHLGTDQEAREILESEQRGAELQKRFCEISRFVPKVFDSGFTDDYFYIAMEFIAGEDLSQAIQAGRLTWQSAVTITSQLCEFLEEADRFEVVSRRVLLHNDLKPRNIRLTEGNGIKVLDFGAAKALSLSRKVTRNDFGSTAYLSPECLESGDRDVHSDAWALGVLLYEMVRGRQPYRADDTRRLESLIRSRQMPESIAGYCPPALEAVIAKLLAPYPADRYSSPAEIRADLEAVLAARHTRAEAEGWPKLAGAGVVAATEEDTAPTRRTKTDDEAPTRRTTPEPAIGGEAFQVPAAAAAPTPAAPPRRRSRLFARSIFVIFITLGLNEGCVAARAGRLANTVALQDFDGLKDLWPEYDRLAGWSFLGGAGVEKLEDELTRQTAILAERVMANYRSPEPTVRENQWKAAKEALERAVAVSPRDNSLRASLRYCEGHIYRIDGEAAKARKELSQAKQNFTDAVVAFREAASLRSNWPDPFLGLARTFIYGSEDVDRGAQALAKAQEYGHAPGDRETIQLADGYRVRGDTLLRTSQTLKDMPQERDYLERARAAFQEALTRYTTVAGAGNAAVNMRDTQRKLDRIDSRLREMSKLPWWPWG